MDEYVKRQLSSVPGHIGFYYKNLVTGETDGSRQTELFQAASVIKLPILAAILLEEREHPGVLQERLLVRDGDKVPGCGALQHISGTQAYDIESLCKLMITISDNTATNVLIRRFGIEFLNERFRALGLQETKIFRFLFDTEAARQGKENLCQPKEIGSLLEEIYHGRCVSANASERMRAMLSQQQINHKIPSLLPPTVRVEHKTGEDEGITNDVGILYGREPCVLVFVSNETDVPAFEQVIRRSTSPRALFRRPSTTCVTWSSSIPPVVCRSTSR